MISIRATSFMRIIMVILCSGVVLVSCELGNEGQRRKDSPNVLLLIVDDLRPALGSFGDSLAISPNIDNIAKKGVVFTNAFAQQALCGPSRTSFLTSRRPDRTRLVDVHYYWRTHAGNYSTLPQYFKEHGYYTQSVGKVFHPGITSNNSDDQPYSWSGEPYHPSSQKFKNSPVCPSIIDGSLHSNIYCPVEVKKQPEQTLPDIQSTEFSLKWLHERSKPRSSHNANSSYNNEAPFFLAVGFHKPHIPLKFPVEFLGLYPIDKVPLPSNRFKPKGLPLAAWNPWNDLRRRDDIKALNVSFPFGPMPDFYSKYLKQGYYAATSYIDSLVGLIVALTYHLFPNTIVVVLGDHGWSLGEHQEWSKFSNYDIATKVPLIFLLPSNKPYNTRWNKYVINEAKQLTVTHHYFKKFIKVNIKKYHLTKSRKRNSYTTYKGVAELLDLFPTLADLAGLPAIPTCPSNSFNITTCTEGISLLCIIKYAPKRMKDSNRNRSAGCPHKIASLSQFPRPGPTPSIKPDSDQPRLNETTIMGYSLRTIRYRYTLWVKFDHSTFDADFSQTYGEELYDHLYDEAENNNLLYTKRKTKENMKNLLEAMYHKKREI